MHFLELLRKVKLFKLWRCIAKTFLVHFLLQKRMTDKNLELQKSKIAQLRGTTAVQNEQNKCISS